MCNIFYILLLILFLVIVIISYLYKYYTYSKTITICNNGKIYSAESLCGGFIDDVLYESNNDLCNIPCDIRNSFPIISTQRFSYCARMPEYITIDENGITAQSDIIIKQHVVHNKIHYKNIKEIKVYL